MPRGRKRGTEHRLTYLEAAIRVLEEAQQPMQAREIVSAALDRGYISPNGKTPVNTLKAKLYAQFRNNPESRLARYDEVRESRPGRRTAARWGLRTWNSPVGDDSTRC